MPGVPEGSFRFATIKSSKPSAFKSPTAIQTGFSPVAKRPDHAPLTRIEPSVSSSQKDPYVVRTRVDDDQILPAITIEVTGLDRPRSIADRCLKDPSEDILYTDGIDDQAIQREGQ